MESSADKISHSEGEKESQNSPMLPNANVFRTAVYFNNSIYNRRLWCNRSFYNTRREFSMIVQYIVRVDFIQFELTQLSAESTSPVSFIKSFLKSRNDPGVGCVRSMPHAVVAMLARPTLGPSHCHNSQKTRQQPNIADGLGFKSILNAFTASALILVRVHSLHCRMNLS